MIFPMTRLRVAICATALLSATPALADPATCGLAPYPPALPSLNDIARLPPRDAETAKHQAFEDVVSWQKGLKTYRDCLNVLIDNDNRKIGYDQTSSDKDDKDEITGLKTDESNINALYNKTVDTEKSIVSGYDSLSKQYCSRKDVDLSSCQSAR
jgi:hypothetical protein